MKATYLTGFDLLFHDMNYDVGIEEFVSGLEAVIRLALYQPHANIIHSGRHSRLCHSDTTLYYTKSQTKFRSGLHSTVVCIGRGAAIGLQSNYSARDANTEP